MLKMFFVGAVFVLCNKASLLNAMESKTHDSIRLSSESVVWYVHRQRNYEPYSKEHCEQIEKDYQSYLKNPDSPISSEFKVMIGIKMCRKYVINFDEMLQKDADKNYRYRGIRRVKYNKPLTEEEMKMPMPLSFSEIIEIGGHPTLYLSGEELLNKKTLSEQDENCFPLKVYFKEDSQN